jgi:hypothetical protein
MQQRGELIDERVTVEAQLVELHHSTSAFETKWVMTADITNTRAQAGDITTAINHEGAHHPTFTWASHNVVTVAVLLDTLLAPSDDGVNQVYHQRKDILGTAASEKFPPALGRGLSLEPRLL